jgi:hypothetical protein
MRQSRQSRNEKILFDFYRRCYKAATPSADFDKLMVEAEINEWGQKDIKYSNYTIDEDVYEDILKDVLKSYRVLLNRRRLFVNTVALGCSPKFKDKL